MWTQASAPLLLLLACCLRPAEAQSDGRRQNIWDDPIKFKTKAKDSCTMTITGHGDYTRLRLSCRSSEGSYWCEYVGKPYNCRTYNKNPRHYFIQMMWGFRKLHNACQAPKTIRPQMCRRATDDSQMIFSSASSSHLWQDHSPRPKLGPQPARPEPRPAPTRPESGRKPSSKSTPVQLREKTSERTTPLPMTPPVESNAKRIARRYCWRSLHGICSFVIGLFRN
ncbi:fibroblast growth factor-binding protein 2 [Hippoglossus hippoglossus]|uniref:fibroblast growth factor-binding protein 2 n=1 Tax=Hippoglossus hippoglossus TaxID=8267 RepID=UPI00148BA166|nr:fibroblast growth factor-binding protein 2 [Hippoglossus hippoglossus]